MARQVQVLPSAWSGVGAGLGSIISSYFLAKRGKEEAALENIGRVFERTTLTGDREPLTRVIEEDPEAAEAFRARTGIDIFRMTLPDVSDMPEKMEIGAPSGVPPVPLAPEEATGLPVEYPFPQVPPAVVQAPQPIPPSDVPWPVGLEGVQARATQEQIAGRELPEALQKPQPSPLSTLTKDWGGIASTLEKLPTQRTKEAFMQAIEPHMPPGFPTEYTGDATEPPSPKDIEIMEGKLYPNMTNDERHTWRTTGIAPFRSPTTPEDEGMRLTVSEFLRAYPHASDEEWVAFLESSGATIPQKAPRFQTDKNTEVSLFNRSFEIAMLTGEPQPEIYQYLANPQMEGAEKFQREVIPKYLVEKQKTDEIRMLRMMLLDAYRLKNEGEAEKMMERLSALTGIPYEKKGKWWERALDTLRGTRKYSGSEVPELETESDFDRAFRR